METNVQIPFQQILKAVKNLQPSEKAILKRELDEEVPVIDDKAAFIKMLIDGPVYTQKEIDAIEENRKSIAKWRTKS